MRETPENTLDLEGIPEGVGLVETLAAVEKRMIIRAMTLSGNVQTKAARILGIGKSGLNQKLKKYTDIASTGFQLFFVSAALIEP
jgi:two-component system NtrC family response regulator